MTLTAEALDIMNLCTNFEFSTVFCYSVSLRATLNRYTCSKLKAFTLHKLLSFIQFNSMSVPFSSPISKFQQFSTIVVSK